MYAPEDGVEDKHTEDKEGHRLDDVALPGHQPAESGPAHAFQAEELAQCTPKQAGVPAGGETAQCGRRCIAQVEAKAVAHIQIGWRHSNRCGDRDGGLLLSGRGGRSQNGGEARYEKSG